MVSIRLSSSCKWMTLMIKLIIRFILISRIIVIMSAISVITILIVPILIFIALKLLLLKNLSGIFAFLSHLELLEIFFVFKILHESSHASPLSFLLCPFLVLFFFPLSSIVLNQSSDLFLAQRLPSLGEILNDGGPF
jgi:hypothetical protein